LQDIDFRSGVPAAIPWPVGKVVTEAQLGLPSEGANHERYERYHQAWMTSETKNENRSDTGKTRSIEW
jgi:hypothetical protein